MPRTLEELYRYPVKGLPAERLAECALTTGRALPHDRRFALVHGASDVDPGEPRWAPKTQFLMLMRNARLASLSVALDPQAGTLRLECGGETLAQGPADDPRVRAAIADAVHSHVGDEAKGAVHLVETPASAFSDVPEPWLSVINLASVQDLAATLGMPVEPLRFRANIFYAGGAPWEERDWIGREVGIGAVRLRIEEPIRRCAAVNVNPASAERDMNLPRELERRYGHVEMGVYASVVAGGPVREGDTFTVV